MLILSLFNRENNWTGCIDFGTAFSKFAMVRAVERNRLSEKDIKPLPIGWLPGQRGRYPHLLPSVVFVTEEALLFGGQAEQEAIRNQDTSRQAFSSPKEYLSTHEQEDLTTIAPFAIDPTKSYTPFDLLALFMAVLLKRAELAAKEANLPWPVPLRVARPGWDTARAKWGEDVLRKIVLTGLAMTNQLNATLIDAERLTHKEAGAALAHAEAHPVCVDGVFLVSPAGNISVPEATAVAAGSLRDKGRRIVAIADIGGGTSDFGCFMTGLPGTDLVAEIREGAEILRKAGGFLDMRLRRIILEKAGYLEDDPAAAGLNRRLRVRARDNKERLFKQGSLTIEANDDLIEITLKEFLADPHVETFAKGLREHFHKTLLAAVTCAERYRARNFTPQIEIMLTGGGHDLPMVKALLEDPSIPWSYAKRAPDLPRDASFDFTQIRPQLAVAIGGAMLDLPKEILIRVPAA